MPFSIRSEWEALAAFALACVFFGVVWRAQQAEAGRRAREWLDEQDRREAAALGDEWGRDKPQ